LGTIVLAFAAVIGALALANPVGAATDGFNVSGTVAFSGTANRTTVRFSFGGDKTPSDIRVLPCSSASVTDSSGPSGTKSSSTGFGGSGQTGVKFQPGSFGNYTVVFSGHIFRVDVVIVSGHQHTVFGLGNATCAPATIPPSTSTSMATTTTTIRVGAAQPPAGPAAATASASGPVASVKTNPAPAVAAATVSRNPATGAIEPAVAGTALARTGRHTRMMLVMAGVALALGGMALMFGEPRRIAITVRAR
jgi:hypothetical protein